jgi:hypothetical protein
MNFQEIKQIITDCKIRESKLSEWEQDFINDLEERDFFTTRQQEKLEQIWNKVTS